MSSLSIAAGKKFKEMMSFDTGPIISFMIAKKWASSKDEAEQAVKALFQWMAAHAVIKHEKPFVMVDCLVDEALHAFMLNSRLYALFCKNHVGYFLNHTPLDSAEVESALVDEGVVYTVAFLENAFLSELSPLLQKWVKDSIDGTLVASSVSCFNNGYGDIDVDHLEFALKSSEQLF